MSKKIFIALGFCFYFTIYGISQELVESRFLSSLSKFFIELQFGISVDNGVTLYEITYTTRDIEGAVDTASGLIVIPDNSTSDLPVVSYQHGTLADKISVPSNLSGGFEAGVGYGAFGYVVLLPDMLGLGESRGFHPFVHADSEAWAAIDMLFALEDFTEEIGITLNGQLFISGYSQGGHAAMAVHESLQRNYADVLPVTASTPMSGPYSISDVMVDIPLSEEEFFFPAYLAFVIFSYQTVYKNIYSEFTDIIKEPYATEALRFKSGELDLFTMNQNLIDLMIQNEGASIPNRMVQPDFLEIILNREPHPFNDALKENDVYNWAPQVPMRLYYCSADDQVSFQNSIVADSVMSSLGAEDVQALNLGPSLNHNQCVIPAITNSIDFFNSFRGSTPVSEVLSSGSLITIYPNPASNFLHVVSKDSDIDLHSITIYSLDGKLHYSESAKTGIYKVNVMDYIPGIYTIQVQTEKGITVSKFQVAGN